MKLFERLLNDRLLAWGTAITAILVGLPLALGAINDRAQLRFEVTSIRRQVEDQESRVRAQDLAWSDLRADVATIRQDVRWLRDRASAVPKPSNSATVSWNR